MRECEIHAWSFFSENDVHEVGFGECCAVVMVDMSINDRGYYNLEEGGGLK